VDGDTQLNRIRNINGGINMKKNKNKQTRSTQSNTNWQHWTDAPTPTKTQPSRRVKARRQFKRIKWCNGHEGPRMDKRFKQMPDGPERSLAILMDRKHSLEWERDEEGNPVTLIRNYEGNFTCTKCGNHVSDSTVDQLARRIERHVMAEVAFISVEEFFAKETERENAAYMTQELNQ
jgi:hypothetical protein